MDLEILYPSFKSMIFNPPPLRVWINLLKYKVFMLSKKKTVKHSPISLVVYVSKRCNFKCEFCFTYSDLNKSNWQESELSVSKFKEMLNSKMGKDSLRVGFLGGEPFLNSDLFEFVEMAHKHGKITTIVTNASLVDKEKKDKLLKSPPTMLGISLYDNNVQEVAELSTFLHQNNINFWVQTVIAADDLSKMETTLNFAKENKIKNLIFSNYHPSYSKQVDKVIFDDNSDFALTSLHIKKRAKDLRINLTLPATISRVRIKRKCNMAFSYVHVDAQGSLGPCCFRAPNVKYGNIFNENDWNNNEIKELRETFINSALEPLSECKYCENFERDLYGV